MDGINFSDDEDEKNNNTKFILNQNNYNNEMPKINKL